MILNTSNLILKSPDEITSEQLLDYYVRNKDFLKEYDPIREDSFYTVSQQENNLTIYRNNWEAKTGFRFFICRKENPDMIIGFVALNNVVWGAFCSCFMGYSLDEQFINRGFMTEAVKEVVSYAFDIIGLHRIEGNIMPRNKRSRAVVEKCGFVNEGLSRKYLKINGVWEDHIHYVMLNE